MLTLTITQGGSDSYPIETWNRGQVSNPAYSPSDTLVAYVYRGNLSQPIFGPTVGWFTALGTQTGWGQGQIQIDISTAQSTQLEANGEYRLEVWWTSAATGETRPIARALLQVEPGPGTATQAIATYCALADILMYAPWTKLIQDSNTDQEGFYSQRVEARKWLDWEIVKAYRGGAWAAFGDASRPASTWSGWSAWRSSLPSPWLQQQLAGGFVVANQVAVAAPGAGYTSSPSVVVPNPPAAPNGQSHAATFYANLNGTGGVGSVVCSVPGLGYTPGTTLTLTFSGGGGSGGSATAPISTGALIIRDQVRRICAYKAIAIIGTSQIGTNNQYANYAQYFADKVSEEFQSFAAELDVNGDGLADFVIPLATTNTIYV